MVNPNNNQNAYHAALEINRALKREIDDLREEVARLQAKYPKDTEVKLTKEEYIAKIGELDGI